MVGLCSIGDAAPAARINLSLKKAVEAGRLVQTKDSYRFPAVSHRDYCCRVNGPRDTWQPIHGHNNSCMRRADLLVCTGQEASGSCQETCCQGEEDSHQKSLDQESLDQDDRCQEGRHEEGERTAHERHLGLVSTSLPTTKAKKPAAVSCLCPPMFMLHSSTFLSASCLL